MRYLVTIDCFNLTVASCGAGMVLKHDISYRGPVVYDQVFQFKVIVTSSPALFGSHQRNRSIAPVVQARVDRTGRAISDFDHEPMIAQNYLNSKGTTVSDAFRIFSRIIFNRAAFLRQGRKAMSMLSVEL